MPTRAATWLLVLEPARPLIDAVALITSPVYGAYANNANTYQVIGAGGAYTFGAATIGATYSNTKFKGFSVGPYVNQTATFNNGEINFKYQLTPALILGAAYDYTQGSKIDNASAAKYHQGSLGVDYFLSKRTDVYVIGVYQHASGNALDADGRVVQATAAINGLSGSSTTNQVAARVGIRHKF